MKVFITYKASDNGDRLVDRVFLSSRTAASHIIEDFLRLDPTYEKMTYSEMEVAAKPFVDEQEVTL